MSPRVHRENCPTSDNYLGNCDPSECHCISLNENDPLTEDERRIEHDHRSHDTSE